jgi:hypothetical protein
VATATALRAVESVVPAVAAMTPTAEVEEGLMAFVDDARRTVVVVARDVTACGVLAALASARARGLEVRLLTADAVAAVRWRLDEVTRLVPPDVASCLVLRDDQDLWRGPASVTGERLRDRTVSSGVLETPSGLAAAIESLWSRAARPVRCAEPLVAGGVR